MFLILLVFLQSPQAATSAILTKGSKYTGRNLRCGKLCTTYVPVQITITPVFPS